MDYGRGPDGLQSFSNRGFRSLSFLTHILGLAVLTHCLSRRLLEERFSSEGFKRTTWARICLLVMITVSWLFTLCSGTIIHGAGFESSEIVCSAASYLNIVFYSVSKFFVYTYLTDRVQVLWSPDTNDCRPRTYTYFTSIISAVVYCIIATLMIGSPISEIDRRGDCVIGLKPLGSIPLLVFHVYVNIFVTFLFLFPLVNWTLLNDDLKQLAYRLALAAFIAFSTSTVNVLVLILSHGREMAWVNMTACVADVTINVVSMFWASSTDKPKSTPDLKRNSRRDRPSSPSLGSHRGRDPESRRMSQRPESLRSSYSHRLSQFETIPHQYQQQYQYQQQSLRHLVPLELDDSSDSMTITVPVPPPRARRQSRASVSSTRTTPTSSSRPRSRASSAQRHSRNTSTANGNGPEPNLRRSSLSTSITMASY